MYSAQDFLSERKAGQGSKWIRREKRLAIYLRDGMQCGWCHSTVEEGGALTLDHLIPVSKGGGNEETNLITSCGVCNTRRGNLSQAQWIRTVAEELTVKLGHVVTTKEVANTVRRHRNRKLDKYKAMAKDLLAVRKDSKMGHAGSEDPTVVAGDR